MLKSNISDVYFHKYPKIKINLDDLLLEKKMKHANIAIFIKSVFNYHNYHETI